MKKGLLFLFALMLGGLFVSGCGEGKPSCDLLYKRLDKCDKMPLKKEVFMEMCKKKADEHQDEIACSAKKDCGEFKKCLEDARKAATAKRIQKRFDEAMAKNDIKEVLMQCNIYKDELSDDLKKKCAEALPKAYDDLMKKAQALRNTAEKADFNLCFELQDYGKKIGEDKAKEAETVCKEIDLQVSHRKAMAEVEKYIKENKENVPFYCMESALKRYDEMGSDFAKEKKAELLNACYVKLGKVILEKKVPEMKGFCNFSVQEIYTAVKTYNIQNPEIDELIKKAEPLCEKKEDALKK